ncbi:MAG TPA: hypothetical protein VF184_04420, partial [Phycisphaeraceae bacterium]
PSSLQASYRYGKAFGAGTDEILLFTDPAVHSVTTELGRLNVETYDVICPHLTNFLPASEEEQTYLRDRVSYGQQLWFYNCQGPTRQFDPSHYRYQPWYCFVHGATGSAFWSFSDAGAATSWNEYTAIGYTSYTPLYIGEETVDRSKHWEAAIEGVQDYEYLRLLAGLVTRLEQTEKGSARHRRAANLLANTPTMVLKRLKEHQETSGDTRMHRSESAFAEQARRQILRLLAEEYPSTLAP